MIIVLKAWILSLHHYLPSQVFSMFARVILLWLKTLWSTVYSFGMILLFDALFFLTFADTITKAHAVKYSPDQAIHPLLFIIILIQSIVGFIISSAFFLLTRKDETIAPTLAFKLYFFRYVQLLLIISLFLIMSIALLAAGGLTKIPATPWVFSAIWKAVEFVFAFYWLNSAYGIKDLALSFEKTINVFFYNLPYVVGIIGLIWSLDYGIQALTGLLGLPYQTHILFSNQTPLPTTTCNLIIMLKALTLRYIVFAVEAFIVAFLFIFYRKRRSSRYATSIFEQS